MAAIGAVASVGGYWLNTAMTGQQFDPAQAAVAAAAGAITGGVCAATIVGCFAAATVTSVAQYALAPGEKSVVGALAAAGIGFISGALLAPWRALPIRPSLRDVADEVFVGAARSFGVSFLAEYWVDYFGGLQLRGGAATGMTSSMK
jgi:hypothetical protein